MARAATSRKRNIPGFGWLTKKHETYRRDVAGERADRLRAKKYEAAEERARHKEQADTQADIQAGFAYETGSRHKREGKRPRPTDAVLVVPQKVLGVAKAKAIARREYMKGYREAGRNPQGCARTLKSNVSDRAKRYRANQKACKPAGLKKCKLCGSRSDVMVDHVDGNESNGRKSNLRWLCRSCNNTLGAEMARAGQGRRTVQYNPKHKGAQTLGEYMQAVLQHTRGAHDAAGKIIHETPKAKRQEFASEIWARRESHGTARPGSSSAGYDEPDWVRNPRQRNCGSESSTEYRLGYNLGQMDRQGAQLRKTDDELTATCKAQFPKWQSVGPFISGYDDGYGGFGFLHSPHSDRVRAANPASARRNPGTADEEYEQAKKTAELFHGRPVQEEIEVEEKIKTHDWYVSIGPLIKLVIKPLSKTPRRSVSLPFPKSGDDVVQLFCSPDGRQFYLRGGDQELNLDALGMGSDSEWFRDFMLIGEAKEITYRDKKKFHKFALTEYYHKLGEVTGKKPMFAYDSLAHKMSIIGGQYKVEMDDLVEGMSPGIVN